MAKLKYWPKKKYKCYSHFQQKIGLQFLNTHHSLVTEIIHAKFFCLLLSDSLCEESIKIWFSFFKNWLNTDTISKVLQSLKKVYFINISFSLTRGWCEQYPQRIDKVEIVDVFLSILSLSHVFQIFFLGSKIAFLCWQQIKL